MSPLQKRNKHIIKIYLTVIGLLLSFGVGIFVGGGHFTLRKKSVDFEGRGDFERILVETQESARENVPFDLYWDIWGRLDDKFVGGEIKDLDLFYGSLAGLVAALGDPYSVFLPPDVASIFVEDLSGSFEGIGAEIGMKDGTLTVIAPLPGSPAERAGVLAGDTILAINEKESFDMTLDEAVNEIRGPRGTNVVLRVRRNGFETEELITITRNIIDIDSLEWEVLRDVVISSDEDYSDAQKLLSDRMGYIKVSHFNEEAWPQFNQALSSIIGMDLEGVVIDLRNNPGGFLDAAIKIASEWLPDGEIVLVEKGRENQEKIYRSSGEHRLLDVPTVILVNEGSASASEILAGALQDHGVATLVGSQTFGKGSVQEFVILQDGSALKLTVAEWLTPKKRQINEIGITPDVVIDHQEIDSGVGESEDVFLKEAAEILLGAD